MKLKRMKFKFNISLLIRHNGYYKDMRFMLIPLALGSSLLAQLTLRNFGADLALNNLFIGQNLITLSRIILTSGFSLLVTLVCYKYFSFIQVATIQLLYFFVATYSSKMLLNERIDFRIAGGILMIAIGAIFILCAK